MDFDIILKFETLKEEQTMMLNFLGLTQTITIHNMHENSRKLSVEQQLTYTKMVSTEEWQDLYRIYEYDFMLFDYSMTY